MCPKIRCDEYYAKFLRNCLRMISGDQWWLLRRNDNIDLTWTGYPCWRPVDSDHGWERVVGQPMPCRAPASRGRRARPAALLRLSSSVATTHRAGDFAAVFIDTSRLQLTRVYKFWLELFSKGASVPSATSLTYSNLCTSPMRASRHETSLLFRGHVEHGHEPVWD